MKFKQQNVILCLKVMGGGKHPLLDALLNY